MIVTHTPDLSDNVGQTTWEPHYFTIESEAHPANALPDAVNLDIESLNRFERQFIINHCGGLFSMTPCHATVLGHVDEIVGRRSLAFSYMGIVADQVDIEALDRGTANPDGMPSMRFLIERAARVRSTNP